MAWLCRCVATLFAVLASHCVDDVTSIEPVALSVFGNLAFKAPCSLDGWSLSASKSPPPVDNFIVIGIWLDLSGVPADEAILKISERRIEQLNKILMYIQTSAKLGHGEAASLTGKLGFPLCACFGRFGRAKLRPFIRRCGETRVGLNDQLQSAITFWLKFFQNYILRRIPVWVEDLDMVVSYSDGEGARAGLGIAVWSKRCPNGPLAAFCEIPRNIRELWGRRRGEDEFNDIYCIEAIGPLAILETRRSLKALFGCTSSTTSRQSMPS